MKNVTLKNMKSEKRAGIKRLICGIAAFMIFGYFFTICAEALSTFSGDFNVRQDVRQTGSILSARPVEEDLTVISVISRNNISSINDYSQWLNNNIAYRLDGVSDEWSASEVTLARGNGDCEDYAFLNMTVLRVLGYTPKVLAVGGNGESHAVCVFKENGNYTIFDNAKLIRSNESTLDGLASYIFNNFKGSCISEMDFASKNHTILFTKTA